MPKKFKHAVGYARVSTQMQDESGYGKEEQIRAVERYAREKGYKLHRWFYEAASGRHRPGPRIRVEFDKAEAFAKANDCVIISARLDRLSRNAAFMAEIVDKDVTFIALDCPFLKPKDEMTAADKFALNGMAAAAQFFSDQNSERSTASALTRKLRGQSITMSAENKRKFVAAGQRGREEATKRADEFLLSMGTKLQRMAATGMAWETMAQTLNAEGLRTRLGRRWSGNTIMRAYQRLGRLKEERGMKLPKTKEHNQSRARVLHPEFVAENAHAVRRAESQHIYYTDIAFELKMLGVVGPQGQTLSQVQVSRLCHLTAEHLGDDAMRLRVRKRRAKTINTGDLTL